MKRLFSVVATATILLAAATGQASARSWRINNNAARAPHFADINAAVASADVQAGDTLYLDPGCLLTTTQNVTKQLTIVGTGYFLTNSNVQPAAISGSLYIKAAGTKIEGLRVSSTDIYIQANNVTAERCHVANFYVQGQHATIRQCYGYHFYGKGSTSTASAYCTIENCFLSTSSERDIYDFFMATIRNNYIRTSRNGNNIEDLNGCNIENNIIVNLKNKNTLLSSCTNCIVRNNVMSCSPETYSNLATDNICIDSNAEDDIFALTGQNDQRYTLKANSPALGAATDGGDCGLYGGLFPYVPSGYPVGMPYFVSTNTPTRSTNGQVKITQHVKLQTK